MKKFSDKEIALLKRLQDSIPLVEHPFAAMGAEIGMTEYEVLEYIKHWQAEGIIRRFGAVVKHQSVGREANALSLWAVPAEKLEAVANALSQRAEVSHCYERTCPENWRYNLFVMIHGGTAEECQRVAEKVATDYGVFDYKMLFSLKEFKKTRLKIF